MPYRIGNKGSNGCSGYPVVDDKGKTVGCHPTKSEATNHMQALYANVQDASKAETPMDVAYNPVVTDPTPASPSSHLNPSVGMKKPQYLNHDAKNPNCQCKGCSMKNKSDEVWTAEEEIALQYTTPPEKSFFNFRNTKPQRSTVRIGKDA